MTDDNRTRTFVFETTHHAMWAEDVARDRAIAAEVVPGPPDGGARCGVALRTSASRADELARAFDEERIQYKILND